MKKKIIFAYPNQKWQKCDQNTNWDLYPAILCVLAAMVRDIVDVKIIDAQFYDLSQKQFKEELTKFRRMIQW
ncbi:MAG: hypothetical protein WC626_06235 [Methanoregula sp.]